MEWGTDMKKVGASVVVFFVMMYLASYQMDGWIGNEAYLQNGWWDLQFKQGSETEMNLYGMQWTTCSKSDMFCVAGEFLKKHGPAWVATLLFWPVIVCCKMIFLRVAPFHLASIGSSTFGAYMIHPYMPIPINGAISKWMFEFFGATVWPWVAMVWLVVYILMIQYTFGRLANHLGMQAAAMTIKKSKEFSAWMFSFGEMPETPPAQDEKTPLLTSGTTK
jgi:hypothetical protein